MNHVTHKYVLDENARQEILFLDPVGKFICFVCY